MIEDPVAQESGKFANVSEIPIGGISIKWKWIALFDQH